MLLLPPHFTGSVEQRKKDDLLGGFEMAGLFRCSVEGVAGKRASHGPGRRHGARKTPHPSPGATLCLTPLN